MEFETTCDDIPCIVRVTAWEPYIPAKTWGPPEDCYPEEGGYGEWELLDLDGNPAPWLEEKLNPREEHRLEQEVFDFMESAREEYEP